MIIDTKNAKEFEKLIKTVENEEYVQTMYDALKMLLDIQEKEKEIKKIKKSLNKDGREKFTPLMADLKEDDLIYLAEVAMRRIKATSEKEKPSKTEFTDEDLQALKDMGMFVEETEDNSEGE
jgi:hypothetical protein